jgi:Tfp pilus assembly protein PilP
MTPMTTSLRRAATLTCVVCALVLPVALVAQSPAPAAAARPAAAGEQPATPAPPAQPAYAYAVEGRRDPFISLLGRGTDPKGGVRPTGLPGMLIAEVSLKGILKERNGFFALMQGPDNKTYQVRSGEKLLDGSVKSINGEAVIFSQDVNDPLSVVKQREIIKRLRSTEEGRE